MQESIHQAATILLLRERTEGAKPRLEVYMTKRPETMRFLPSHHVFPGGQMDESDSDPRLLRRCAALPPRLNPEGLSLAYWVTAIRETFEEVGLLLARHAATGQWVTSDSFAAHREALLQEELTFAELIEQANLELAVDQLRYFGHRLTPRRVSRKRFDTRYFLTILPGGADLHPHAGEVAEAAWLEPQQALAAWATGKWFMVPPTVDSLRVIGQFSAAEAIWLSNAGVGTPTAEELA